MPSPVLVIKALGRCLQSPAFARDLGRYVANDVKSALGMYRYPMRRLFIIGLSLSGDAWLHDLLSGLPGFNPRHYPSRSVKDEQGRYLPQYEYDNIDESFFGKIPNRGHSVFHFHIRASERNLAVLTGQTPRWVVMHRDLRDLCVSRYFYHRSAQDSHFHPLYQTFTPEQALDHSADLVRDELVPWMQGWRAAARKFEGRVCEVRYEDLWADPTAELRRILAFFGIDAPESFLRGAAAAKVSCSGNGTPALRLLRSSAARPDGVGAWKKYFSERHKEQFKKAAGDLLIEMGYEKDFNW